MRALSFVALASLIFGHSAAAAASDEQAPLAVQSPVPTQPPVLQRPAMPEPLAPPPPGAAEGPAPREGKNARGSEAPPLGPAAPDDSPAARKTRLDALFAELKTQGSAEAAARTAAKIETEWASSGSATVDLLMFWAGQAVAKEDAGAALDLLDQAVTLAPGCAEAWNRRATVSYATSNFGKSLADIEQTLALEPRHFGALMGLGMILEETDRKPQALDTYMRALAVYPTLKTAQDAVARLADELTGQAI